MANYKLIDFKWNDIKEIVDSMYFENTFLTPYSDYGFLNHIINNSNIRQRKQFKKCYFKTFVLFKDDNPVYVVPLLLNNKEKTIYLAGHFNSVGHVDFIYKKDVAEEDFQALLEKIKSKYGGYSLLLDRISQFSKTYSFVADIGCEPTEKETCVKIDFTDYNTWFSSLSKSCRQNIRTAYNRMNRENKKFRFLFYINEQPTKKYYKDHISLFSKRILEHSKLPKALFIPMKLFKQSDPLSKALLDYKDKIFAGFYIDNQLAGTLNGVISNDGRVIVTRLSVNVKFGVYSPGGLLINETIKAITSQNIANIKSLDLSRGDEKYKYTYGGIEHFNYSFILRL